jgi:hypothetical protein
MSLYRQAGRRSGWLVAFVSIALVVGFLIGLGVSRATTDDKTFEEAFAGVQADADLAADAFELVGLHYATAPEAARQQLERGQESFDAVEPELELVSPAETRAAAASIQSLSSVVDRGAPAAEVERAAQDARAAVRRAARLR